MLAVSSEAVSAEMWFLNDESYGGTMLGRCTMYDVRCTMYEVRCTMYDVDVRCTETLRVQGVVQYHGLTLF